MHIRKQVRIFLKNKWIYLLKYVLLGSFRNKDMSAFLRGAGSLRPSASACKAEALSIKQNEEILQLFPHFTTFSNFFPPIFPTKLQHFPHSSKYFSTFLHKCYYFTNLDTPLYIVLTQMPSADAQALQVARVKTDGLFREHHKFDRREINSGNSSKNI